MGIQTDAFASAYKALTRAVHDNGGAIAIQLVHAGGQANPDQAGCQPVAPSAINLPQYPAEPAELSAEEIQEIINAFGEGARRAKAWGFDAVQLHGAHGYLINQFLSPLTNRRNDNYGGSLDNRCRFLMKVYHTVRQAVGEGFPVMIKLNGSDNLEGGLSVEDALHAAAMLDQNGIDAIEISSGSAASGMDHVAIARPLIREPDLPNRWQKGDRSPAKCISCNKCFIPGLKRAASTAWWKRSWNVKEPDTTRSKTSGLRGPKSLRHP